MFDQAEKQPKIKKKGSKEQSLNKFEIHVMPKALKEKPPTPKAATKKVKKPIPVPAPVKPQKRKKPIPALRKDKKSKKRFSWPLIISGIIFIIVLIGLGIWALSTIDNELIVESDMQEELERNEREDVQEEPVLEVTRPGSDLDSDGLSDIEEGLYGTDVRNPDSDFDTFLDGNEVFHRYSPLGEAPQTLLDTGSVQLYEHEDFGFSLTYPSLWVAAQEVDRDLSPTPQVIFRTNSTAVIRLDIIKALEDDFLVWYGQYVQQRDLPDYEDLTQTLTKTGYIAYLSPDERIAYIVDNEDVYVFTYDLADELEIVYLQTFQMMINSFLVL